ncbi:hypothetical protein ACFLZX_02120 [Nanoarchaeota archaeon]
MKRLILIVVLVLFLVGCEEDSDATVPVVEDVPYEDTSIQKEEKEEKVVEDDDDQEEEEDLEGGEEEEQGTGVDIKLDQSINPIDLEVDLLNFPEIFLGDLRGKTVSNVIIVVGRKAPGRDVISGTLIASAINGLVEDKDYRVITVMDDEVSSVLDRNAIIIGNPCDNSRAQELTNILDCHGDMEDGKAMIRLYQNNGFIQMHVLGYDEEGTYAAAVKLSDVGNNNFDGKFAVINY